MLTAKGILTTTRNARNHINDALIWLPDEFVNLKGCGYWVRRLPYGPAGYRPTEKAVA